jgi:hypothetical protein
VEEEEEEEEHARASTDGSMSTLFSVPAMTYDQINEPGDPVGRVVALFESQPI